MEDKIYVLSDGRVRRVPAAQEEDFQNELKSKGLTAVIESDMSGNQISSTGDATVEQDLTASTQEVDQPQNNQQKNMDLSLDGGSLESRIANGTATAEEKENFINKYAVDNDIWDKAPQYKSNERIKS